MTILLSGSSKEAIYLQIINQVREQIISGELAPKSPLPSVRKLASQLQVSVITTRRAYEELEKEGLIESRQGKGSFVCGDNDPLMTERKKAAFEEKMIKAVEQGRLIPLSKEEFLSYASLIFDEVNYEKES